MPDEQQSGVVVDTGRMAAKKAVPAMKRRVVCYDLSDEERAELEAVAAKRARGSVSFEVAEAVRAWLRRHRAK